MLSNQQDVMKAASKESVPKTAEAAGDLIGNKIANKITSASKSSKEVHLQNENGLEIPTERYISP